MIQELTGEQVMKQIIEPEVQRVFAKKYPTGQIPGMSLRWPPILEEDRNKKADRVIKAVGQHPIMTINEARSDVGLPPLDNPEYNTIPENVAAGGGTTPPSKNPEQSESERTGPREEALQKRDHDSESLTAYAIPTKADLDKLRTKRTEWQR